jgi:hypothetical protein
LNEFKQQITADAETATPEMPRYVWVEMRLDVCLATNGMQMEIHGQIRIEFILISVLYFFSTSCG